MLHGFYLWFTFSVWLHISLSACLTHMVGSVTQWLGCWSLVGGLSLPFARSVIDRWPLCALTVRYGSANSAFHPSGVGKLVVHDYIYLHGSWRWRPNNDRLGQLYGCTGQSPWAQLGLLWPRRPCVWRQCHWKQRVRKCSTI